MLEQLARNPLIQKYIPGPFSRHTASTDSPLKTLEAVYFDTARLIQDTEVLSKEEASSNLVELMELFPDTTKFFINAWTWGYEDVLKAVARNFSSKVAYIPLIVVSLTSPIDTRQPLQVQYLQPGLRSISRLHRDPRDSNALSRVRTME
jgi:hypothetical protein